MLRHLITRADAEEAELQSIISFEYRTKNQWKAYHCTPTTIFIIQSGQMTDYGPIEWMDEIIECSNPEEWYSFYDKIYKFYRDHKEVKATKHRAIATLGQFLDKKIK